MANTKLTEELIAIAVKHIEEGATINLTCGIMGINKATWFSWMNRGAAKQLEMETNERVDNAGKQKKKKNNTKEGKDIFQDFHDSIKKAESNWYKKALGIIQRAAGTYNKKTKQWEPGQWQALAWIIERRNPTEFALKQTVTPETVNQIQIQVIGNIALNLTDVLIERGIEPENIKAILDGLACKIEQKPAERIPAEIKDPEVKSGSGE